MTNKEKLEEIKKWLNEKNGTYKSAALWRKALIRKIARVLEEK